MHVRAAAGLSRKNGQDGSSRSGAIPPRDSHNQGALFRCVVSRQPCGALKLLIACRIGTRDAAAKSHRGEFAGEADFQRVRSCGLNSVRLPFGYWVVTEPRPATKKETSLEGATARHFLVVESLKSRRGQRSLMSVRRWTTLTELSRGPRSSELDKGCSNLPRKSLEKACFSGV